MVFPNLNESSSLNIFSNISNGSSVKTILPQFVDFFLEGLSVLFGTDFFLTGPSSLFDPDFFWEV
jgi:hypothetical protein